MRMMSDGWGTTKGTGTHWQDKTWQDIDSDGGMEKMTREEVENENEEKKEKERKRECEECVKRRSTLVGQEGLIYTQRRGGGG